MKRYLRIKANMSDGWRRYRNWKKHSGGTQSKVSTAKSSDAAFVLTTRIIDKNWNEAVNVCLCSISWEDQWPFAAIFLAAYKIRFYLLAWVRIDNKQIKAQSKQNAFLIDTIG